MSNIKISMPTFPGISSASALMEMTDRERHAEEAMRRVAAEKDAQLKAGIDAIIEQRDLMHQHAEILHEQNALLAENYDKLKEMYDAQVQANIEAKAELVKTKRHNAAMMVVSVLSLLVAVASTLIPLFVNG